MKPDSRVTAEELFNRIGYGHGNAIKRPKQNSNVDRALRKLISYANTNGDCIICGDNGYYRPLKDSNYDNLEFNKYIKQAQASADSINKKISCMQENYEKVEEEYLANRDKDINAPKPLTKPITKKKSKKIGPSNSQIDKYLKNRKSK